MATLPSASSALDTGVVVPFIHSDRVFVVEKTFNLATLLSANLAAADVVNLLSLPANTLIIGASVKIVTAGSQTGGGTFTGQLRFGATPIGAALDFLTANGVAIGGYGNSLPAGTGSAASYLNLLIAQTVGTVTGNPTVRVHLICADLG